MCKTSKPDVFPTPSTHSLKRVDLLHTIDALRLRLQDLAGIAFVPTMGNLHAGHLELIRIARAHGSPVVASIFVNPLQFGPQDDFEKYPRTLEADCTQLRAAGCDVVFAPSAEELYPMPQQMQMTLPPIADELCGAFRPGHFQGVATVVAKLFNIVQPAVAVFGKKDYQQLAVIRALVQQFNFPIAILAGETVRAADGLALSSRNSYLSLEQRAEAPRLYQTLQQIEERLGAGEREYAVMENAARTVLEKNNWRVDYIAVREAESLLPPTAATTRWALLGAAWLGETRLIDSVEKSF